MKKSPKTTKAAPRRTAAAPLRLLAGLADEIRIPLANILAMNRSLLETDLSPEQRENADKARASADSLLGFFNDLVDYSRMEAGKLSLEKIDFDLRTTIEQAVHMLAPQARQKGLELAFRIHPDVPSLLSGDPGRLRRILLNLMRQAIQSTDEGQVLIHATPETESPARATVHFAVMDTGGGIPKSLRRVISHSSSGGEEIAQWGASEIDLAISRKIVEMMGGRMGYESRRGEGSTFWFTAPLRKQTSRKKEPRIGAAKIEGRPILIVDEHSATRQHLLEQLRAWGCLPEEAAGGKKALAMLREAAKAKKTAYPLVILRREMKEIDGIALGREIKKDPRLSSTILVLLTSQGKRGDGKVVQQIGFAAYLTQPVTGAQLRDCLELAMARKASPVPSAGPPLITRFSLEEDKKRRIRVLLAEDDPGIQKAALQILRNIGYDADVVADGKEVLSALEKSPYDLILMDTEMPRMDGFSTTGAVRGKEKNSGGHIPIIGMTARPKEGDRDRCLETGMDDYIVKPIQAIDVADVLDRFFSQGEPERA